VNGERPGPTLTPEQIAELRDRAFRVKAMLAEHGKEIGVTYATDGENEEIRVEQPLDIQLAQLEMLASWLEARKLETVEVPTGPEGVN